MREYKADYTPAGIELSRIISFKKSHFDEKSVALGFVPTEMAAQDESFEIEILGQRRPATVTTELLPDPKGPRMRA